MQARKCIEILSGIMLTENKFIVVLLINLVLLINSVLLRNLVLLIKLVLLISSSATNKLWCHE
jgi:hypothetical protein